MFLFGRRAIISDLVTRRLLLRGCPVLKGYGRHAIWFLECTSDLLATRGLKVLRLSTLAWKAVEGLRRWGRRATNGGHLGRGKNIKQYLEDGKIRSEIKGAGIN